MKLIKQVRLFFQEGTSDKAYEIDLYEGGEGFLVNFRYGRRNGSLKEGTKTIFPVSREEAEKIFNALEQEKRKKGYAGEGEVSIQPVKAQQTSSHRIYFKIKKFLLRVLKEAAAGEQPENLKLSRVVWRVGELKVAEAIPFIMKLEDTGDLSLTYSSVWTIGRCGNSTHIPYLTKLAEHTEFPEHLKSLIREAILQHSTETEKQQLLQNIQETLPTPLKESLSTGNFKELERQLKILLFELKTTSNEYLISLYQLARFDSTLYAIFIDILDAVPTEVNYFKYLRHIFKTAEMLDDTVVYGIIGKNIEKRSANYKSTYWISREEKMQRAFSDKTKDYLTRRVLRRLRQYGESELESYTQLATGLLLAFDDSKDYTAPRHTSVWTYNYNAANRTYNTIEIRTDFDSYSNYKSLYYILYKLSQRYVETGKAWKCVSPYKPGNLAPEAREEAFPRLWDNDPDSIIRLLSESNALRVHEFANKVYRANPSFEEVTTVDNVKAFLLTSYEITQKLGLDLARKKYTAQTPDKGLLLALLNSQLEEARQQAEHWINEQRTILLSDTDFVVSLLQMRSTQAHTWLRAFLSSVHFDKAQSELLIAKSIAFIVSLPYQTEEEQLYIRHLADTLVLVFADALKTVSLEVVKNLFAHPSEEIQALAAKLLLRHEIQAEDIPAELLQFMLQSGHAATRGIGLELLGRFPEAKLMQRKEIIISFCLSPLPDVRNAVVPIITKLVKTYSSFAKELVELFVPAFLMKESYEGLHDDLLKLISEQLTDGLSVIDKKPTMLLLNSRFRAAQQLGAVVLKKQIREDELSVEELVKLSGNPLLEVRQYVWNSFEKDTYKIRQHNEEAIRIADSDWDDTRVFAFDYFRKYFSAQDWTVELLVSLTDSVREDVQDFGREMISRNFNEENGTEYLLKLGQHPGTKIQLYTSSFIADYASGKVEIIDRLTLYFVTLLSQVNKGKVAKARAFDFLRKESLKSEEAARLIAGIFSRVSVSMALSERAACIEALRDINKKFPMVTTPVQVKEFADYIKK